jgi:hypothetical protein
MLHEQDIIEKVSRGWNNLQRDVLWQLHFNRSRIYNAKGGRILVYHGICINNPFRVNTLFIKLKNSIKNIFRLFRLTIFISEIMTGISLLFASRSMMGLPTITDTCCHCSNSTRYLQLFLLQG